LLYHSLRYIHQPLNKKLSRKHGVFITEFGTGRFTEIMCKVLRKSMRGEKVGQVVLVIYYAGMI